MKVEPNHHGEGLRIGIVVGRFNQDIGDGLLTSCTKALASFGVKDADVTVLGVPGALEIPLALQTMAKSNRYDALIALGAVIRGETYHFELVCNESARGVTQVQLDHMIPIANAILTVENAAQAEARIGKGAEAARVAVELALTLDDLVE